MGIKDFFQQDVIQFRADDQIRLRQAGVDKWMKVSALISWVRNEVSAMSVSVSPHTHAQTDVTDLTTALAALSTALAGKAATAHGHATSDITGLDSALAAIATALSNKSSVGHGHATSDITGLDSALAAVNASLSALSTALAGKANTSHTHAIGDIQSNFADGSGTFARLNGAYPALVKATVASGNAVFYPTQDNLPGGAAIFANGPIKNSLMLRGEEGTNPIATGVPAWTNSDKTITVPVSRTGAAVTILGISVLAATVQANGVVMYALVWGR